MPWTTWLLFTGAPARCAVLSVRCPGPLRSSSPLCSLRAVSCVCGVMGHLAPVYGCARSVCCVACEVSWATWLLFTDVPARCVVLCVRCSGPLGSCPPMCPLGALCCLCGVLDDLAPVNWCARSMRSVACAVFWATRLLITAVPARSVVSPVRCPGPIRSCSPVCQPGLWCCVCGVPGHLAPVHWCARSVRCVACAVSWATWLLLSGVRPLGALCCVCGVLNHLAPVHRCARPLCCVPCAVSWATRVCRLSLWGALSSVQMAAMRNWQELGTLRARRRLSGRRLVCSCQGLGTLLGAHSSIQTAPVP